MQPVRLVSREGVSREGVRDVKTAAEAVAMDTDQRTRTVERLRREGVTVLLPETCLIDGTAQVGQGTVIEPNVQLLGAIRIGAGCLIRSGSVLEGVTLGDEVVIRQYCVLTDAVVESHATIGPFAHLRPGSEVGEQAHVGNFVEMKRARLGKGAKAGHLSYLGDAGIGDGTNIGAGVITCNYDGVNKHRTRIGQNAFVGSDTTLVAPLTIGDGAYVGAGSCITRDVPPDALAVGRSQQIVKPGWAARKRATRQESVRESVRESAQESK